MKSAYDIDGILIIDKPQDLTSRDVVNRVSKILGTKKIGHTGTLDPLATGVLILTIGKCTKLTEFLMSTYKEYIATFMLGYETDTLDKTGTTTYTSETRPREEDIIRVLNTFRKTYKQEVPKYSAIKVDGKKLYDYARDDEEVVLPKKEVTIKNIEVLSIDNDTVTFKCLVSKGTYIRSLIRDIGRELGTYATMTGLRRTKQGNFNVENSYSIEDIEEGNYKIISPEEILKDIKTIEIGDELYKNISNGVKLKYDLEDEYLVFKKDKRIIALYKKDYEYYRMYVKF